MYDKLGVLGKLGRLGKLGLWGGQMGLTLRKVPAWALAGCLLLAACGGGTGNGAGMQTLGGTVSGLSPSAQMTIQNGLSSLVVSANGRYALPNVSYGASYNVRVVTQPTGETCTVAQGSGTVSGPIGNANISCTRNAAQFGYILNNLGGSVAGSVTAYSVSSGTLNSPVALATGVNPVAMVVNPAGTYLFVVNAPSAVAGTISVYQINRSTGALTDVTPGTPAATGVSPTAIAVDPSGSFLYVTDSAGPAIRAYAISASTLTVAGSAQLTGTNPQAVAVAPGGNYAYVANYGDNSVSGYSISRSTGALTPDGSATNLTHQNPAALLVGPAGNAVYTANSGDFSVASLSVNAGSGLLTNQSSQIAGTGAGSLAVDPNGQFLLVASGNGNTVDFYTLDGSTGALSTSLHQTPLVGPIDTQANIALDPTGAYAYVTDQTNSRVYLYAVDSSLGVLSSLSPVSISATTPVAVILIP